MKEDSTLKKTIVLLLALIFVFGLASFAAAEVTLSGDARVRGHMITNYDTVTNLRVVVANTAGANENARWFDQRVRLALTGENDFGAAVKMRMTLGEGNWDGGANHTAVGIDGDDYLYLAVPVGEASLTAGYMPTDWGHKFWSWGKSKDRIKYTMKGDALTWGVHFTKENETFATDNLDDMDTWAAFAIGSAGEFKVGAAFAMTNDNATTETSGSQIDVFISGAAGPAKIAGEIVMKSGELWETTASGGSTNNQMGFFVNAGLDFDAVAANFALAYTKNGFTANKFFMPTLFLGQAQVTAAANVGTGGDTTALLANAGLALSDSMKISATLLMATVEAYSAADVALIDDFKLTEVDVKFSYAIGEGTSYSLGFGNVTVDPDSGGSETITVATNSLNIKL
jgi:hypothetical protein